MIKLRLIGGPMDGGFHSVLSKERAKSLPPVLELPTGPLGRLAVYKRDGFSRIYRFEGMKWSKTSGKGKA